MAEFLSLLAVSAPVVINFICILLKRGKGISLIATLCGSAFALFFLLLNNGYGIGFGNPWIGVDWRMTAFYGSYLAAVLFTHAKVPCEGRIRTASWILIVLIAGLALFLIGMEIRDTIAH